MLLLNYTISIIFNLPYQPQFNLPPRLRHLRSLNIPNNPPPPKLLTKHLILNDRPNPNTLGTITHPPRETCRSDSKMGTSKGHSSHKHKHLHTPLQIYHKKTLVRVTRLVKPNRKGARVSSVVGVGEERQVSSE